MKLDQALSSIAPLDRQAMQAARSTGTTSQSPSTALGCWRRR